MASYNLANQAGAAFRAALNVIIADLQDHAYGTVDPNTGGDATPGMFWMDTNPTLPTLKMRNAANNAWITLATINGADFQLESTTLISPTIDTNFTFDGNVITGFTGSDVKVVTGTAGTSGNVALWNPDGDIVSGYEETVTPNVVLGNDSVVGQGPEVDASMKIYRQGRMVFMQCSVVKTSWNATFATGDYVYYKSKTGAATPIPSWVPDKSAQGQLFSAQPTSLLKNKPMSYSNYICVSPSSEPYIYLGTPGGNGFSMLFGDICPITSAFILSFNIQFWLDEAVHTDIFNL